MMVTGIVLMAASAVGTIAGLLMWDAGASSVCTSNCFGSGGLDGQGLNPEGVIGIATTIASGVMGIVGIPLFWIGKEEVPYQPGTMPVAAPQVGVGPTGLKLTF